MRLTQPRIEPLKESEWTDEQREMLNKAKLGDKVLNIFATLARHPSLLKRFTLFGNHILFKNTLTPRQRELAILRVGWLCRAGYEWGQHVVIGRRSGIEEHEFARIAEGPSASGWSDDETALLQAVDELHADAFITEGTWNLLTPHFNQQQLLDLVFTTGQYNMVSMALNTFGVQLDGGAPTFAEVPGFSPPTGEGS